MAVSDHDVMRPRRSLRMLRLVYLIGLFCAAVWVLAARWGEVRDLVAEARLVLLGAAFMAGFGLIWFGALFWAVSLRMLGQQPRLSDVIGATARALPARYLPVGVTFAIGRVALLRRHGLALGPLALSAILEMAISLAVALAYGAALLAVNGALPGGWAWPAVLLVVVIGGASPAVFGRMVSAIAARRGVSLTMTWGGYLRLVAVAIAYWTWAGLTFLLYLRAFPAAGEFSTGMIVGAFMLAWGVGFLSLVAPQGIGVAEVAVASLLGAGDIVALAVVVGGYRLILLARDLLAAAAAEFSTSKFSPTPTAPPGSPTRD